MICWGTGATRERGLHMHVQADFGSRFLAHGPETRPGIKQNTTHVHTHGPAKRFARGLGGDVVFISLTSRRPVGAFQPVPSDSSSLICLISQG